MMSTAFCPASSSTLAPRSMLVTRQRSQAVRCSASQDRKPATVESPVARREFLLASVNVGVLASLFTFGATPRPNTMGIQDYGSNVRQLQLCPPAAKNCIGSADEANDMKNYVPAWTYNAPEGRGRKKPVSQEKAMAELKEVVSTLKPDKFEATIIKETPDYLYAEFQSPTFGFIDDVEFYFTGKESQVEYRSASRLGESDGDINRKRIRAIRQALEKKGWKSLGY